MLPVHTVLPALRRTSLLVLRALHRTSQRKARIRRGGRKVHRGASQWQRGTLCYFLEQITMYPNPNPNPLVGYLDHLWWATLITTLVTSSSSSMYLPYISPISP